MKVSQSVGFSSTNCFWYVSREKTNNTGYSHFAYEYLLKSGEWCTSCKTMSSDGHFETEQEAIDAMDAASVDTEKPVDVVEIVKRRIQNMRDAEQSEEVIGNITESVQYECARMELEDLLREIQNG